MSELFHKTLSPALYDEFTRVDGIIQALPRTPKGFGFIHNDLHYGNFTYESDSDRLWVFDFDDCCYSHFAADVAVALYAVTARCAADVEAVRSAARGFLSPFLSGYREVFAPDAETFIHMDAFYRYRLFFVLQFILTAFDGGDESLTSEAENMKALLTEKAPLITMPAY